jgi:hypothetical protein
MRELTRDELGLVAGGTNFTTGTTGNGAINFGPNYIQALAIALGSATATTTVITTGGITNFGGANANG